ncbi:hypothetical protein CBR_g23757 [Chara braunii]|uniref:Endoglucanase n=1 Tax=Chara braunii TaxID=69332 RepID=A0A388JVK4_CHABU|nr:hypothetical protein CBR_g23757 [Chara braunii]|eukprot:GBG61797.1 hypothetical protein CBR_g23757 [Chara braunii]
MEPIKRSLSNRSMRLGASEADARSWGGSSGEGELETDSLLLRKDDNLYENEFEEVTLAAERNLPQALPSVRLKRPHGGPLAAPQSASQNVRKASTSVPTVPTKTVVVDDGYRNGNAVSAKSPPSSSPMVNGGGNGGNRNVGGRKANAEVTAVADSGTRSDSSLISSLGIRSGHRFVTEIGAVEIENMEKMMTNAAKEAAVRESKDGSKKGSERQQQSTLHLQPFSYMPRRFEHGGGAESSDDSDGGSDGEGEERDADGSAADLSLQMPYTREVSRGSDTREVPSTGLGTVVGRSQLANEAGYEVPPGNRGNGDGDELEMDHGFGKKVKDPKSLATSKSGQCFTLILVVLVLVMAYFYLRSSTAAPKAKGGVWETKLLRGQRSVFEEATGKTFLFLEAQRSGKLPVNNRVPWRGDSGLSDGKEVKRDLTGGYYDSGDSIKFNFPMAFTITMLSWGVAEYKHMFGSEIDRATEAIKWGTDYILKCWDKDNEILFVQVGDPELDHPCWLRPEDTTIPRKAMAVNASHPGSDVAGEMSAALAAASIALGNVNETYRHLLLSTAADLCEFAMKYKGYYTESVPSAIHFYNSTEYEDELLWCNAWLYRATGNVEYLEYAADLTQTHQSFEFSWDSKHAGLHVLITTLPDSLRMNALGKVSQKDLDGYSALAEQFTCFQMSNQNPSTTAGLAFLRPGDQLEYVAASVFIVLIHADFLKTKSKQLGLCKSDPDRAIKWVQYQSEYVLGNNPLGMSYMVGLGEKYPFHVHHRGASIAVPGTANDIVPKDAYTCKGGRYWLNTTNPDPNVISGAIVGGPSQDDQFLDIRLNYTQSEPSTYISGVFSPVFARLTQHSFTGQIPTAVPT